MSRYGIHHFSTSGDTKASVVERFNRTLKQRLYRYFTTKNSLNFVPVLPKLVAGYNRSYLRSIKMAPDQVTVQERLFTRLDGRSVCGETSQQRNYSCLQSGRVGWHTYGRHFLRAGFTKSQRQG